MKLSTTLFVTLAVGIGALPARAQPSDSSAAAEVLFEDAKALMARGEYDHACPKLEASLKLEPALGTRVNLADCYEAIGKLASAWSMFRAAADIARIQRDPREKLAVERAAKLEPRLPKLSVIIQGQQPPGLAIVRSGTAVEPAMLGTPIYVDPGRLVITATAPGFETYETTIDAKEGELATITIPELSPARVISKPTTIDPRPTSPREWHRDPGRKRIGLVIAGSGILVAGTGLGFGWSARDAWSSAFDNGDCDRASRICNARGQALTETARTRGWISTALVGTGVAAIAVGVVVFVTAPKRETKTIAVTPAISGDGFGVAISGSL